MAFKSILLSLILYAIIANDVLGIDWHDSSPSSCYVFSSYVLNQQIINILSLFIWRQWCKFGLARLISHCRIIGRGRNKKLNEAIVMAAWDKSTHIKFSFSKIKLVSKMNHILTNCLYKRQFIRISEMSK